MSAHNRYAGGPSINVHNGQQLYSAFDPDAMPLERHRSPLDDAVRHCDVLEVNWLFLARKKTLADQEQNRAHQC